MDKAAVRRASREALRRLGAAYRAEASRAACERLLAALTPRPGTVALYVAVGEEADPGAAVAALLAAGTRVLLPRVAGEELELAAVRDLRDLRPGFRGIPEPPGPAVPLEQVGAVVTPGVAFDRAGTRLGRGSGHYDRLLARLRPEALRIGFCFEAQVAGTLPRDPHDQPVDVVVTERQALVTGARLAP